MNKIQEKVEQHHKEMLKIYGDRVLGTFLYGSQNYNLDTPTSDVDTKSIIVPTENDLIWGIVMTSNVHIVGKDKEHADAVDIRRYVSSLKKQSLNFLETLFTKYFVVNPLYEHTFFGLVNAREQIALCDKQKSRSAALHQALSTAKRELTGKNMANAMFLYQYAINIENTIGYPEWYFEKIMKIQDEDFKEIYWLKTEKIEENILQYEQDRIIRDINETIGREYDPGNSEIITNFVDNVTFTFIKRAIFDLHYNNKEGKT